MSPEALPDHSYGVPTTGSAHRQRAREENDRVRQAAIDLQNRVLELTRENHALKAKLTVYEDPCRCRLTVEIVVRHRDDLAPASDDLRLNDGETNA